VLVFSVPIDICHQKQDARKSTVELLLSTVDKPVKSILPVNRFVWHLPSGDTNSSSSLMVCMPDISIWFTQSAKGGDAFPTFAGSAPGQIIA
jgi:hypothetical protein